MPNSLSLLELFSFLDRELGICLQYDHLPWRQSDQRVFVADIRKANRIFGWQPATSFQQGLTAALAWSRNEV